MMNRQLCAVATTLVALAFGVGVNSTNAAPLWQHQGQLDPVSQEGWNFTWNAGGGDPTYGPVSDPVGPTNAFHLASTNGTNQVFLRKDIGATELSNANTNGWSYALTLRTLLVGNGANWGIWAGMDNGTRAFYMQFGTDGSGNAQVALNLPSSSPVFTLGDNDYHTYEFRGAAGVTNTVDFYIDGVLTSSGYAGWSSGEPWTIAWGTGQTVGDANFASVEFNINAVPEPASCGLMFLGLVVPLASARRRLLARRT